MKKSVDNIYFSKIVTATIVVGLLILSFFILKPILLDIIFGFILAFVFFPIYNLIYKITKSPNFSASLICIFLIVLLLLPLWFFTPIVIKQGFKIYLSVQQIDFVSVLTGIFPSLFASEQFSAEIGSILYSFTTRLVNSLLNELSQFILNFPVILLHSMVVLFTFFFALRDRKNLAEYIKGLSPFSKDVEKRLFQSSKDITASVLYGQVVVGIIQGLIMAIGFFLFGIPNALLLSVLAVVAGIIPIIGPMLIWVPVFIYLLIQGNTFAAIGILIIGLLASNIDSVLRSIFISKRTKLHSAIILIGMIGGLFLFGILGLILGPLILAYLLIILEVYRNRYSKENIYASLIKND